MGRAGAMLLPGQAIIGRNYGLHGGGGLAGWNLGWQFEQMLIWAKPLRPAGSALGAVPPYASMKDLVPIIHSSTSRQ